jgi:hypothetical protein
MLTISEASEPHNLNGRTSERGPDLRDAREFLRLIDPAAETFTL